MSTWWEAEAAWRSVRERDAVGAPRRRPRTTSKPRSRQADLLNTAEQVARWKDRRLPALRRDDRYRHEPARPAPRRAPLARRPDIDTLHSHLACADEDHALERNAARAIPRRRAAIRPSATASPIRPGSASVPSTASISSGPGLALYGGVPRREAQGHIRQVARVEAQMVQRRTILVGESCGYGATFTAEADTEAAILNIGYADGYLRGFSSHAARRLRGQVRCRCSAGSRWT